MDPLHKKIKSEEKMKGHGSNCVSFFLYINIEEI